MLSNAYTTAVACVSNRTLYAVVEATEVADTSKAD